MQVTNNGVTTPVLPTGAVPLLKGATTATTGQWMPGQRNTSFQASVVGTGTVGAVVIIEATNDGIGILTLGTITLSGASPQTDGFAVTPKYAMVRARMAANPTGTGAAVTVTTGG